MKAKLVVKLKRSGGAEGAKRYIGSQWRKDDCIFCHRSCAAERNDSKNEINSIIIIGNYTATYPLSESESEELVAFLCKIEITLVYIMSKIPVSTCTLYSVD